MASSKRTIDRDGRRRGAENCDARPARAEDASDRRKSFRDVFRDRDPKPEKTSWDNLFKTPGGSSVDNSLLTAFF
jgi:hypothetical protein